MPTILRAPQIRLRRAEPSGDRGSPRTAMVPLAEIDLTDRLAPWMALWMAQILVGVGCALAAMLARAAVDAVYPGAGPFSLAMPFVLAATLFGRWQAGVIALLIGALHAWYFVLPEVGSFRFAIPADAPRVVVNVLSGCAIVALAEQFRRAVRRAVSDREARLAERDLLLRELDHRVKNNFALMSSLTGLERRLAQSPEARDRLDAVAKRIESVVRVHAALYRKADGRLQVAMSSYLDGICRSLETALLDGRDITMTVQVGGITLDREIALTFGLLVNELVTNAAKHAFPDGRRGHIAVSLEPGDTLVLRVSDNGVGAVAQDGAERGSGMNLITSLVASHGGEITRETDGSGTTVTAAVPAVARSGA